MIKKSHSCINKIVRFEVLLLAKSDESFDKVGVAFADLKSFRNSNQSGSFLPFPQGIIVPMILLLPEYSFINNFHTTIQI
jgi:hypothetical protein